MNFAPKSLRDFLDNRKDVIMAIEQADADFSLNAGKANAAVV